MARGGRRRRLTKAEIREREAAERLAEHEAEIAERKLEQKRQESKQEARITDRLENFRIDHEARKRLKLEITRRREFNLPEVGWTAEQFLAEQEEPPTPIVEGLHFDGGNTMLIAEFKTGKTRVSLNLAGALADGLPFLSQFKTNMPEGRIAFLNYEMPSAMFREWLRPMGLENADRIVPLNLRGWTLAFWEEEMMLRLADWLLKNNVKFIVLDPAARAWRGLVEAEGDNVQLSEFFGALDEVKRLADAQNLLITAHKPRSNEDRARGGGEIEAWPDANWYLGKEKDGRRTFRAFGRDVDQDRVDLTYEKDTGWIETSGPSSERAVEQAAKEAHRVVKAEGDFPSTSKLVERMKGKTESKRPGIKLAVQNGWLEAEKNGQKTVYSLGKK